MTVYEARRVDVAPLRDAFQRSGLTSGELCHLLGWYQRDGTTDVSRLKRALGLKPYSSRGRRRWARRIGRDPALIAEALNVDPVDIGL